MVRITCDACKAVKTAPHKRRGKEEWILGYDLQADTAGGSAHVVRFLQHWDDARIQELGSIHLCSEQCKQDYLRKAKAA